MKNRDDIHSSTEDKFPPHLLSHEALEQHFRANLQGLNSTQKGHKFASSMIKLIPQTEAGVDFVLPTMNSKISGDGGVDLKALGKKDPRKILYIQSKLWVDRTEDIDSVLSKFHAYEEDHLTHQNGGQLVFNFDDPPPSFLLVTLSPLESLIKRYESRSYASRTFYQRYRLEQRIHFIDGYDILSILRAAYLKISEPPSAFDLKLVSPAISKDNVFIGIISSDEIKRLYHEIGDALFFENIRDFQGITSQDQIRAGRTTPNDEIVRTLTEAPARMLERNNGIVFKAQEVRKSDDLRVLTLVDGSLINGCQTSMCIVEAATVPCYISIKVVQTSNAWDITKAANYQNSVDQIDLDIARSIRPQLLKRAAAVLGARLSDRPLSAFQIIDDIYDQKVAYEEVRLLFIGVFSKDPNNVFGALYTGLMQGLVDRFYKKDKHGTKIYEVLFALQEAIEEGIENARKVYSHASYASEFERLYENRSLTYRCFIGILAICAAVNVNVAIYDPKPDNKRQTKKATEIERKDDAAEYERMENFLEASLAFLQDHREQFLEYYLFAVKVWMDTVSPPDVESLEVRVNMYRVSKSLNFTNLFRRVCREADLAHRSGS